MLRSGLTIFCYTPDGSVVVGYQRLLENLQFTTSAPGGFQTMRATIKLPDARIPHPELALFSRVAVMGHGENGPYAVWLGEIMDAPLILSASGGEAVEISALGIGNCLRDDPLSFAYVTKTPQTVAIDQLTGATSGAPVTNRANAWPLDQDTSALFPDNPASTFSLSYTNRNGEEVLGDIATLAGSASAAYIWGTRAHASHVDVAGFPTGQLYCILQDTATTAYQASLLSRDITAYRVTPTSDRAYNVVKLTYNDTTSTAGFGTVTSTDPRLGANGAQGTAPFRRRTLVKELAGLVTMTSVHAQAIADQLRTQYQNITNKVSLTLVRVRNAQGVEIPLWAVAASQAGNIYVPELAVRGAQLATGALAGVNQFFIVSATYREGSFSSSSDKYEMSLSLECDNYVDQTQTQIARLQLLADSLSRQQRTTGNGTALGAQVKGWYEILGGATGAGNTFATGVTYPNAPLSLAPSNVTLTSSFSNNSTNLRFANLGVWGFTILVDSVAAGVVENNGVYLTIGNCLSDVDLVAGTFTHHCEGTIWDDEAHTRGHTCDTTRTGLSIGRDTRVHIEAGREALMVDCPVCGSAEGFNLTMGPEDEDGDGALAHHHHKEQARAVRALMAHPAVGLHHLVRECRCEECAAPPVKEGKKKKGKEATDGGPTGGDRRGRGAVPSGGRGGAAGTDGDDPAAAGTERRVGGASRGSGAAGGRARAPRRAAGGQGAGASDQHPAAAD